MPPPDWSNAFAFSVSPLELVVRGTLSFLFLFCMFRFVVHRDVGELGVSDLLVLVIIADASQNAMAGEYHSLADGAVLVGTIIGWSWLLNFLSFHFEPVRRIAVPRPLLLIKDGVKLRHNMKKQLVTDDELDQMLREHEIDDVAEVRRAYLEPDGQVTVLRTRKRGGGGDEGGGAQRRHKAM